jgi:hypothetical protein
MFGDLEFDLDYSSDTANSDGLVHTVICACGVVGNRDGAEIRSVTVVGGRRLTGAELLRVRETALAKGVRIFMDGDGTITLRPLDSAEVVIATLPRP